MSTLADTKDGSDAALSDEIEHYLHGPGTKPKVAHAPAGETLREVLVRFEVVGEGKDGLFVFVGQCVEALGESDEVDDGIDTHPPVDIDLTLAVLEIERHRHVHVHPCRHIAVTVNFGKPAKRHRFAPNTTLGTAAAWARRKFHLDPAVAAEYVLQICDSTEQPRSTEHLGDLVDGTTCSLCFDLVKEITPKG